jgi:hypothetical protein
MLLNHDDIDTNLKNKAGSTALDIARKCNEHEIAQCLEEHAKVGVRRREAKEESIRKGEHRMIGV